MSCGCENKKKMCEYAHVRQLAKKAALLDGVVYVVYKNHDGTYNFDKESEIMNNIVEYIYHI